MDEIIDRLFDDDPTLRSLTVECPLSNSSVLTHVVRISCSTSYALLSALIMRRPFLVSRRRTFLQVVFKAYPGSFALDQREALSYEELE